MDLTSSAFRVEVNGLSHGKSRHHLIRVGLFPRRQNALAGDTGGEPSRDDPPALYRRLTELGAWPGLDETLKIGPSGRSGEFNTADTDALLYNLYALQKVGRLCVDSRSGKILHPGAHALRELSNRESLHVAVYGNRVRAHLDRISPLAGTNPNNGQCRYSALRVAAHVTGHLGARLVWGLKGGWIRLDIACSRLRLPQS